MLHLEVMENRAEDYSYVACYFFLGDTLKPLKESSKDYLIKRKWNPAPQIIWSQTKFHVQYGWRRIFLGPLNLCGNHWYLESDKKYQQHPRRYGKWLDLSCTKETATVCTPYEILQDTWPRVRFRSAPILLGNNCTVGSFINHEFMA